MAAAQEQIPPSELEIRDQQRKQWDVNRLQHLPPLVYDRMNQDQRCAFIQWYQQTPICRGLFRRYQKDYLEGVFAAYPREEPDDTVLNETLSVSFRSYLQETWSSYDKQPPQPDSYFLLHKRFSRLIDQGIYLPTHQGIVLALLLSQQEVDRIGNQGLTSIITAIGTVDLHFHGVGTLYPNNKEKMYIYLKQNGIYFRSANEEFMMDETTEVWFRRTNEGIPQFIFCTSDSVGIPLLPLPLSTPGFPNQAVELSRLDAMPALQLERSRAEHKSSFYQWLLTKDRFKIRYGDPQSLKLAAHLFQWSSSDVHIVDPEIPRVEVVRLYENYIQEMWSMPSKQSPEPRSIYLFEKYFFEDESNWITLPSELMQKVISLVLTTEELNQLAKTKGAFVTLSITTHTQMKFEKRGTLEHDGKNCKITCFHERYADIFCRLLSEVDFEVWFVRARSKPKFIIKPQKNSDDDVKMKGVEGQLMKDESGPSHS